VRKWADAGTERKQRHELRRETILQAAARCFNRLGYRGTTIEHIARELGVSKAALYYYVKSKEEIFFQCHQAAMDIAMEGLRRGDDLGGTPADRLRAGIRYYVEHLTDHLKSCVLLAEEAALQRRLYRRLVAQRDAYEQRVRTLVEQGVARGEFRPYDAKLIVFAMLGALQWIPKWYRPGGTRSPREIADAFADYLVGGLTQCPAGTGTGPARGE
jgi:TetR/AcrR family transcriptional regulator